MKAIVYSKPVCQACRATKRKLTAENINFDDRNIESYPNIKDMLLRTNQLEMPYVVIVDDDGQELDHWSGLRMTLIEKWGRGKAA